MRLFLFLFSLCGMVLLGACGKPAGTVKGVPPRGQPRSILAVKAGDTPPVVTIRGVLVEKCPVAGCWFRIQDDSGIIKADTKTAGFVVTEIPLQTTLTVGGKVTQEDAETILDVTGLQY